VIWHLRAKARMRLALAYLSAAVLLGLIAAWAGGLAMLLWWGAIALAAVAVLYAGPGAAGFQKKNGRHPLALAVLLAPYFIGEPYGYDGGAVDQARQMAVSIVALFGRGGAKPARSCPSRPRD
jgi:hypothetical protein